MSKYRVVKIHNNSNFIGLKLTILVLNVLLFSPRECQISLGDWKTCVLFGSLPETPGRSECMTIYDYFA